MKPNAWQNQNKAHTALALKDWLDKGRLALHLIPKEPVSSLYAIIAYTLEKPRSWIQAHTEFILSPDQIASLNSQLKRLLDGEPLPYITGIQAFFGIDFHVTPDVLIPRPETELLVEAALNWLGEQPGNIAAADIGTGSGCIAVSIAKNDPSIKFLATDRSFNSLQIAKENIRNHQVSSKVNLLQTNLLSGVNTHFDLICANLPYIPTSKLGNLRVSRYEPLSALDGGIDGLEYISELLDQIHQIANDNCLVLLEIESDQSAAVYEAILSHFPKAGITITNDLNNLPRLVKITL